MTIPTGIGTIVLIALVVFIYKRYGAMFALLVLLVGVTIGGASVTPVRRVVTATVDAAQVPLTAIEQLVKNGR